MRIKKNAFILLLSFLVVICVLPVCINEYRNFFSFSKAALSKYGTRSDEVKEIQTRLKKWGYYDGSVDGIYGYKTYSSVREFQYKNGLKVDGIAGENTLAAMGIPSSTQQTNSNANDKELKLLAHIIYGEARGEPYIGQVGVAAVVLNRVKDSRFPNSIAGVIYQPRAFTAVSDGQFNLSPDETAYRAARDALNGWDPTKGCVFYFNPKTATSNYIFTRRVTLTIGKHSFAK